MSKPKLRAVEDGEAIPASLYPHARIRLCSTLVLQPCGRTPLPEIPFQSSSQLYPSSPQSLALAMLYNYLFHYKHASTSTALDFVDMASFNGFMI